MMVIGKSLNSKDIIELLSRLKAETPEYPTSMLAQRRANFQRQAATLKIKSEDQGGEGGQQGSSRKSGTPLNGSTTVQGIILWAVIGIGLSVSKLPELYFPRLSCRTITFRGYDNFKESL